MNPPLARVPERYCILLVDDEPDIHAVTKLGLKGLHYEERKVRFLSAASAREALDAMRSDPEIAVVLLDVVMETNTAGLDACKEIRDALGNRTVRILLRTGQPGFAPEREVIDSYDIDGYLPKAELSTARLYSAVRSALKTWTELVELERLRQAHEAIHEGASTAATAGDIEAALGKVLQAAVRICPSALAVVQLVVNRGDGAASTHRVAVSAEPDAAKRDAAAEAVAARIARMATSPSEGGGPVEGGYCVSLTLPKKRGGGWIYLEGGSADEVARRALPVLAAHAAHALHAVIA